MKFAIISDKLTPEPLLNSPAKTKPITTLTTLPQQPLNPNYPFSENLRELLSGKQLLMEEIPFTLEELHRHYENGFIFYRKGIEHIDNKPQCNRCGATGPRYLATFPCLRCGERCLYCRNCLMMGRVSECTPLIGWKGPEKTFEGNPALVWSGQLSEGQRTASERIVELVERVDSRRLEEVNSGQKPTLSELLIWAVCGAGKTEVLFAGIEKALQSNLRVCIATPRTDVVLELTPRLKAVFPNISVASLHGGSEDRHLYAPLTISTTHQLFRFYKAFDLIIVDEVDAFPYSLDYSLQHAVLQARKNNSAVVYLTATPNTRWQTECTTGKRNFVTIPARFHRHPLPVPTLQWCGNWQKLLHKNQLPRPLEKWLQHRVAQKKQILLFLPRIDIMEEALPLFQQLTPKTESVHAEDPNRKEKVQRMRRGETELLLTTTILERGVTFPNIDVAVLGAEDRIFTESALVQIAGRAGRSAQYPDGDITFFHYGKTEAMVRARNQILTMNKEAKEKGLIN